MRSLYPRTRIDELLTQNVGANLFATRNFYNTRVVNKFAPTF
jgi:hypothetical protein